MQPIIGIAAAVDNSLSSSVRHTYVSAIERAGGAGVILPYTESSASLGVYSNLFDGFMFIGGGDIDPARYGMPCGEKCDITAPRDEFELSLLDAVLRTGKPIMGICRGLQLINVALGGTLIADLDGRADSPVRHKRDGGEARHKIRPLGKSGIHELEVNSYHHQAVLELGRGLVPLYVAEDGIIESFRHTRHPYLYAYQWHPEIEKKCDECGIKLFYDFISACRAESERRIKNEKKE